MDATSISYLAAGIGVGMTTIGASLGISRLASSALEGIARQPEASAKIQSTMIISAALIEGIALFGEVVCILLALK